MDFIAYDSYFYFCGCLWSANFEMSLIYKHLPFSVAQFKEELVKLKSELCYPKDTVSLEFLRRVCESQKNPEIFNSLSKCGLSQFIFLNLGSKLRINISDINQQYWYVPHRIYPIVPKNDSVLSCRLPLIFIQLIYMFWV